MAGKIRSNISRVKLEEEERLGCKLFTQRGLADFLGIPHQTISSRLRSQRKSTKTRMPLPEPIAEKGRYHFWTEAQAEDYKETYYSSGRIKTLDIGGKQVEGFDCMDCGTFIPCDKGNKKKYCDECLYDRGRLGDVRSEWKARGADPEHVWVAKPRITREFNDKGEILCKSCGEFKPEAEFTVGIDPKQRIPHCKTCHNLKRRKKYAWERGRG